MAVEGAGVSMGYYSITRATRQALETGQVLETGQALETGQTQ